jgi:hypothetical protein
MDEIYKDFILEWKKIRSSTSNEDRIIELLREKIDFRNLAPHNKAIGKPKNR